MEETTQLLGKRLLAASNLTEEPKGADPVRIVLRVWDTGHDGKSPTFATHAVAFPEDKKPYAFWGHYKTDFKAAFEDYFKRCEMNHVRPDGFVREPIQ